MPSRVIPVFSSPSEPTLGEEFPDPRILTGPWRPCSTSNFLSD
jgi:hypothetical protein